MIIVYAENNDGEIVEWPDRLRVGQLEVTIMAEECQSGSGEVVLDDATADFYVRGLKPMYFVETEAEDDDYLGIIGPFWTERRRIGRGSARTGSQRQWTVALRDLNSLLTYRVQKGTDAERDEEDHMDRLDWLINTAEVIGGHGDHGFTIEDTSFVFDDGTYTMSESDYTGQYSDGVINDLMQQSGANCYLYNAPNDYEPIRVGIWYGRTERSDFTSIHKISNVLADISEEVRDGWVGHTPDHATPYVFPPSLDTELERDPSRQITGAMVQYDGDYVYASNPIITPTLTRRDMTFEGGLVKTASAALARAQRYLADLEEEDDGITTSVLVPAKLVHAFMPGHRVGFKNSYMPGYESDYVNMRVAKVTYRHLVGEDGEAIGFYELGLDLRAETPPGPALPEPPAGDCIADDPTESQTIVPNNGRSSLAPGLVHYWFVGMSPPVVPDDTFEGDIHFAAYGSGGSPDFFGDCAQNYLRFTVVGAGTLTIHTTVYSGARTLIAQVKHLDGVVETIDQQTIGIPLGSDIELTVSTHSGEFCYHYIDITDVGGSCGSKWGWSSADWVSAE